MLSIIRERFRQGHRTGKYPQEDPTLPARFRGRPLIDACKCPQGCQECLGRCPFGALTLRDGALKIDLGRCLFCPECAAACPHGALTFGTDHRLATSQRQDLVQGATEAQLAKALDDKMLQIFGRSLKLRQVSSISAVSVSSSSPRRAMPTASSSPVRLPRICTLPSSTPMPRFRSRRSLSPPGLAPLPAALFATVRKFITASAISFPSTFTSPAARRTLIRFSTACYGCSDGCNLPVDSCLIFAYN